MLAINGSGGQKTTGASTNEIPIDVVDPEGVKRREQVLDGLDSDAVSRETGGVIDVRQVTRGGRDPEAILVHPDEDDPTVSGSRLESQGHFATGMKTDPDAAGNFFEGALFLHTS